MLKLNYSGPKPIISQHGIFFKKSQEDKYVYLKVAIKILLSIDKQYKNSQKHLIYINSENELKDEDVLEILKSYELQLEEHINYEETNYEQHIDEEIEKVKNNHTLNIEEQRVWINNINIMRKYMIQREINKLYYIHTIKAIKQIIYEDKIDEIDIDFSIKHWHILESIAGNLEYGVKSIHTDIKIIKNKEGILITKLFINPSHN